MVEELQRDREIKKKEKEVLLKKQKEIEQKEHE